VSEPTPLSVLAEGLKARFEHPIGSGRVHINFSLESFVAAVLAASAASAPDPTASDPARDAPVEAVFAALRKLHVSQPGIRRLHPRTGQPTEAICTECDRPWPCDTSGLLGLVPEPRP
jgi:hypothetical protein